MHRFFLLYLIPSLLIGFISCQRDDDEPPAREIKSFSRLYISTSDYQAGASSNLENIWVVDPVDQEDFPSRNEFTTYVSAAKGGKMIHFSPLSDGMLFQGSINTPGTMDTSIYVLTVSKVGALSSRARLSNRRFDNVRGLFYTVVNSGNINDDFLIALNKSDTVANANLFAFRRPVSTGNYSKPRFEMSLDFNPWGLTIYGKDIYMVKTGDQGGIVAYKGFTQNLVEKVDTVLTNIPASYTLTVEGARNLRGIAYSSRNDILVVTDYGVNNNVIEDGKILIFENFSTHNTSKTLAPTRVIQGLATKLKQPMDIAIDSRENGHYIYVADAGARRVFRYSVEDSGNVAPNAELNLDERTPVSISLDAR